MLLPGFLEAAQEPDPGQAILRVLGAQDVLVTAPAGCGKTEALAERAGALIDGGAVQPPRRLLALTFSNRAKDNISSRLRALMGPAYRTRVSVTNFHGFAARIIRAHGASIGLPADAIFPERGWRAKALQEVLDDRRQAPSVEAALRSSKCDAVDDDEVWRRLNERRVPGALKFEEYLREEHRLDFDDLLRHAERILNIGAIARLYRLRFAAVLVDEVQDLTEQQLRIAEIVGYGRLTTAGDDAQAIYGFAGAAPERVLARIRASKPAEVALDRSYRSAPAVLRAVNAVANYLGAGELVAARPDQWLQEGVVALLKRRNPTDEADEILNRTRGLLVNEPAISIGVISRRSDRRRTLERNATENAVDFEAWDVPTHNAKTVGLLRRYEKDAVALVDAPRDQVEALEALAHAALDPDDFDGRDDVTSACAALMEMVDSGDSLSAALGRCRRAPALDAPVAPGVHLLNAHLGKGQQFDWVFVLGMEEGHVPDYRARSPEEIKEELRILHVMASRARFGLVFTVAEQTQNQYGRWFVQEESRWLTAITGVATETW